MAQADVQSRLAELATTWALDERARSGLALILEILDEDPHAPTTVRDPSAAVDVHIADSLSALALPEFAAANQIADLGSGAGFPGLPLALALPKAAMYLVESNGRKAHFLTDVANRIAAANVTVVPARVEEWSDGRLACDIVTARAVAPLVVLTEYAAPLLRLDGVLVAWKGRRDADEEARAARAADVVGLAAEAPLAVDIGHRAEHRHLHVFRKVAETPARFPRRPGMASKRPIA